MSTTGMPSPSPDQHFLQQVQSTSAIAPTETTGMGMGVGKMHMPPAYVPDGHGGRVPASMMGGEMPMSGSDLGFCNDKGMAMDMLMMGFQWTFAQGNDATQKIDCLMLFFPSLTMDTRWKFGIGMVFCFLLGVVSEWLVSVRRLLQADSGLSFWAAAIAGGTTPEEPEGNGTASSKSRSKNSEGKRSPRNAARLRALQLSLLFGLNMTLAYAIMLVAMTYSLELFLVAIFGLVCGHAMFNVHVPVGEGVTACCTGGKQPAKARRGRQNKVSSGSFTVTTRKVAAPAGPESSSGQLGAAAVPTDRALPLLGGVQEDRDAAPMSPSPDLNTTADLGVEGSPTTFASSSPAVSPTTALGAGAGTTGAADRGEIEVTLRIDGMTCGACEETVRNALKAVDGIEPFTIDAVSVDAEEGTATVTLAGSVTPGVVEASGVLSELAEAVECVGFDCTRAEL